MDGLPDAISAPPDTDTRSSVASGDAQGAVSRDIDRAREEERTSLARELHDEIGGSLSAMKLMLVALRPQAHASGLQSAIAEIESVLDQTMESADRMIRAMRPAVLDRGIVGALRWEVGEFEHRHHIKANFSCNREHLDIPSGQGLTVYRVCQEALANVARHARATRVDIQLFRDGGSLTLEITDNGKGFDPCTLETSSRLGVVGMRERARSFGGWVEIDSRCGSGTTVMLQIPLRRIADIAA